MKFQDRYSKLDRLLHRLAFSTINFQKALVDIENLIYSKRFKNIEIDRPVFITALPRAGTTLLLEILSTLDCFATHTYRNMPFLMTPLLWHTFSRRLRADSIPFKRAHGDGMIISYDSPEAFEETLWHAFWPDKYFDDRIATWTADDRDVHGEFDTFFKAHVSKIIALQARATGRTNHVRYLSKNNMNVSRIPKITRLFPDAIVLVLFRDPFDHAASLLRQHRNFLNLHTTEPFTQRYMRDIGHFDFGANFRPVCFDPWLKQETPHHTDSADFWLRYWCAAYRYLLAGTDDKTVFVSYDSMLTEPVTALSRIAQATGLQSTDLAAAARRFRSSTRHTVDSNIPPSLLEEARELHRQLLTRTNA